MKGVERVEHLARIVGLEVEIVETGHPDWVRGFINANGTTLGRAVIERGVFTHVNWYCRPSADVGPWDYWFHAWNVAANLGTLLEPDYYAELCEQASKLSKLDFIKKRDWRRANPKAGSRKKLTGRSQQAFLFDLLNAYMEGRPSEH